jgi:dipeptidase E
MTEEAEMKNDLLLHSSSRVHGGGYLAHAMEAIDDFLHGRKTIYFVPYAIQDHDGYIRSVQEGLSPLGVKVVGLNQTGDPKRAVEDAEVLFVGGGNTFRLVKAVQQLNLIEPVRRRVAAGELSYMGSSAGTNMACPTIRTTNDMPIVQPDSFDAFALILFQINPHYVDADPTSTHMGETRMDRIVEFLEENEVPVLAMREGAWLRGRDSELRLGGPNGALLFRRGADPEQYEAGANLSFLLGLQARFDQA